MSGRRAVHGAEQGDGQQKDRAEGSGGKAEAVYGAGPISGGQGMFKGTAGQGDAAVRLGGKKNWTQRSVFGRMFEVRTQNRRVVVRTMAGLELRAGQLRGRVEV